jgi:hypothetical protein
MIFNIKNGKAFLKNFFLIVVMAFIFSGCAAGPCWQAMKYRKAAETAQGTEKAALLGKADAVQKECDAQNAALQEKQKDNARLKDHP